MGGTLTTFIALDQYSVTDRGEYTDTLLGPERTRGSDSFQAKNDETGSSVIPPSVLGLVLRYRINLVCCLRTAQWTRASLLVSDKERTVDALAPGADEGRSRLR